MIKVPIKYTPAPCTFKPTASNSQMLMRSQCCSTTLTRDHAAAAGSLKKYSRSCNNLKSMEDEDVNLDATTSSCLGARWMDYQGMKNWEGLLDPLDNELRGEIIRYGHFVEAAYRSCDFRPSSPSYAKCTYSKRKLLIGSGFPDTGYRVTRHLNATSGIQLPQWIEKGPGWTAMRSSWIGYVAVCHDKREITRLGRRDVVIAFRGTATCLEWLQNLRATLAPLPNTNHDSVSQNPMVESGFLSLYTSRIGTGPSLQDLVRKEISRILQIYGHGNDHEHSVPLSFTFTGHSLGAALATLAAYDVKETLKTCTAAPLPLVTVVSFGGPRVGNQSFRNHLEKQGTKILRIVNSDDVITKVPGFVIDHNRDDDTNNLNKNTKMTMLENQLANWIQKRVEETQWVYADVGCELRLRSRDSPHLSTKMVNIATCHELTTYLQLINGFVSSNCPLRATARKMINNPIMVV